MRTAATTFGFAGTSAFGADCLGHLHRLGVPIGVVLTQPDRPAGRRRVLTPPPVAVAARALGLPVLQPERAGDAMAAVRASGVAAMAICAYGQLIRLPFLEQLPWLNLHPSALPRWRGAAPVERALLGGDTETAVAVMLLVEALDAGPVAAQIPFRVGPEDDAGDVMATALALGVPALAGALRAAAAGTLDLWPQPTEGQTYAAKLSRADRLLDPAEPVAVGADRVRALSPHVGAQLRLGAETLTVWRARPWSPAGSGPLLDPSEVQAREGRLLVGCADGALELLVVQAPGRRAMAAAELLRGRRGALGPASRADSASRSE